MPIRSIYFSLLSIFITLCSLSANAYNPSTGYETPNVTYGFAPENKLEKCERITTELYTEIVTKLQDQEIQRLNTNMTLLQDNCDAKKLYLMDFKNHLNYK